MNILGRQQAPLDHCCARNLATSGRIRHIAAIEACALPHIAAIVPPCLLQVAGANLVISARASIVRRRTSLGLWSAFSRGQR